MARGNRLRVGRRSISGQIYLITTVCVDQKSCFFQLRSARAVVQSLMRVEVSAATLCYVVMPDHLHWLMQLQPGAGLSETVRLMKVLSTRNVKTVEPSVERLWQRGFHDRAIRREEDIRAVARYVIGNPLRAGLVESVGQYGFWDAKWL